MSKNGEVLLHRIDWKSLMIKDNYFRVLNKQMIICDERISTYYLGTNFLAQTKNFVSKKKLFRVFKT